MPSTSGPLTHQTPVAHSMLLDHQSQFPQFPKHSWRKQSPSTETQWMKLYGKVLPGDEQAADPMQDTRAKQWEKKNVGTSLVLQGLRIHLPK